jgi:hypothetical protein
LSLNSRENEFSKLIRFVYTFSDSIVENEEAVHDGWETVWTVKVHTDNKGIGQRGSPGPNPEFFSEFVTVV